MKLRSSALLYEKAVREIFQRTRKIVGPSWNSSILVSSRCCFQTVLAVFEPESDWSSENSGIFGYVSLEAECDAKIAHHNQAFVSIFLGLFFHPNWKVHNVFCSNLHDVHQGCRLFFQQFQNNPLFGCSCEDTHQSRGEPQTNWDR